MYNNRSNVYREVAVQTASPAKLVAMLYEGAIRFLRESAEAIESRDLDRKRQSIDRAMAIVQHLHDTLDMDRGREVARNLDRLYSYISARIVDGSMKLETAPLEEAIKLLKVLHAGWEEVAKQELSSTTTNTIPGPMLAQRASGGFALHA